MKLFIQHWRYYVAFFYANMISFSPVCTYCMALFIFWSIIHSKHLVYFPGQYSALVYCLRLLWLCHFMGEIKNNAWVTVNNDFFVTSEAIRQWFSRVTKSRVKIIAESPHEWQKIVIHGNECIILFLTRYFMSWTHKFAIIERSFRHCCQGRPFLTEHCDVTTIDLWRHANAKYWYCDVIFVYCHCTRKLAQRRSSLVNNSREYRYLATRYSRLSV